MKEFIQLAVKPGDFFNKNIEVPLDKMPFIMIVVFFFWFNILMNKVESLSILLITKNIIFIILILAILYVYIKIAYYITYKFYNFRIKLSWWESNELLSKKIILYSNIFVNFFYSLLLLIAFFVGYFIENLEISKYIYIVWISAYYLLFIHSIFLSYKWLTNNVKIHKYKSIFLFVILPFIFYVFAGIFSIASVVEL